MRIDKWLWFARFVKTRSLASKLVIDGRMRVNGAPTVAHGETHLFNENIIIEFYSR